MNTLERERKARMRRDILDKSREKNEKKSQKTPSKKKKKIANRN